MQPGSCLVKLSWLILFWPVVCQPIQMYLSTWTSVFSGGAGKEGYNISLAYLDRSGSDFPEETIYMESCTPGLIEALQQAKDDGLLDSIYKISIVWRNDWCDPKAGMGAAVQLKQEDNVDVVLGPLCSTVAIPAGYYFSYWNIPMFSHSATDPALADKKTYNTLVRVNGALNKLARAFVELFHYFEWTQVVLMVQSSGFPCEYGSRSMEEYFREGNIKITELIKMVTTPTDHDIDQYLERTKQRGRIIIVCHSQSIQTDIMLRAHELGMTGPDWVYWMFRMLPDEWTERPWIKSSEDPDTIPPAEIARRKQAFRYVKQVTMSDLAGPKVDEFLQAIPYKLLQPPWNSNISLVNGWNGSIYSLFLYDATYLYMLILNETLAEGGDYRNGTLMFEKTRNRTFQGMTGKVVIDAEGDREPDFWIWHLMPGMSRNEPWTTIKMTDPPSHRMNPDKPTHWGTEDGLPPLDTPKCGFLEERCPDTSTTYEVLGGVSVLIVIAICAITGVFFYRRKKLEDELQQMLWRVYYSDIEMMKKRTGSVLGLSFRSMRSQHSNSLSLKSSNTLRGNNEQLFTQVAIYRGNMVAIRKVHKESVTLTRADLLELKVMREIHHDNLVLFVGACVDPPNICILTQYCPKGSLQDILENEDIKLDWLFKSSLISDLANGLGYLHHSELHSHGNLKSSCCLIDSRWVLKLTSFGLSAIKHDEKKDAGEYQKYKGFLWTAPELLRMAESSLPVYGTQKGDVYSLGIILQEIVYRSLPFFIETLTPKEVVDLVHKGSSPPFRPELPKEDGNSDTNLAILTLMKSCWEEDPDGRPNIDSVLRELKSMNKGRKVNIMESMMAKLEKYANNLEEIVEHRTEELMEEKKKTDLLLHRMLPPTIANQLKQGKVVQPEIFDQVTIYFSDIVGFTSLSSGSTPMEVVDLLNDLYTMFDDVIAQYDVYKVETIGDAYMVVSGLPHRNGNRHAGEVSTMALHLLSEVLSFKVHHRPDHQLKLRIGLHTGSCAAGVVGLTMPRYCLFGDTVNMASRMESTGMALRVHISQETYNVLEALGNYSTSLRGDMEIKGKGLQKTYWLNGKQDFDRPLPEVDDFP